MSVPGSPSSASSPPLPRPKDPSSIEGEERREDSVVSQVAPRPTRPGSGVSAYVIGAFAVLLLVALCTPARDNMPTADAWEHQAAVHALTHNLSDPGNPVFSTDHPSIRYSPYSVALAWLCQTTGLSSYDALSLAGVINTLLLLLALWGWTRSLGAARLAPATLLFAVLFYIVTPGYANSLALADLPWMQVNPSAFAFALALFGFASFERALGQKSLWLRVGLLGPMMAVAMLSHGMTGVFFGLGLMVHALARSGRVRTQGVVAAVAVGALAGILCLVWPWYSFYDVLFGHRDDHWFNPTILTRMLLLWCLPAAIGSLAALPYRQEPAARVALLGTAAAYLAGVGAFALKDATLARLPLPAFIFSALGLARFAQERELLQPSGWVRAGRDLLDRSADRSAAGLFSLVVLGVAVAGTVIQVRAFVREPYLARGVIAPLLGRENKQLDLRSRYEDALAPIEYGDVVLASPHGGWPVPSVGGRIVTAMHWEYFVPGQAERWADVERFFGETTDSERREIVDRYNVDWILVESEPLDGGHQAHLLEPAAVAKQTPHLTLMKADPWARARSPQASLHSGRN